MRASRLEWAAQDFILERMTLPDDISDRARELHRRALVVDAHADTLTEMTDRGYDLDAAPSNGHIDFTLAGDGALDVQVFTCFVRPTYLPDRCADRVRAMLDTLERQLALFPERIALCRSGAALDEPRAAGKLGAVLAIEGGHAIENDLAVLAEFGRRGVRTMTLTWNNTNDWADGCGDEARHGGLTDFGRDVVSAMEDWGMVVDVSHAARSTFDDVLAVARKPLIASHSCADALRPHVRNLTDDQLRAIAATGGVACVNFYPRFLVDSDDATLHDVLDHVEHFLSITGPRHVGLGGDFDGIPHGPRGLENAAALPRLTEGLLARGIPDDDIVALLGANLARVFDGAEPAARDNLGAEAAAH